MTSFEPAVPPSVSDRLVVATWNVNSIRARLDHLERFVKERAPDVVCLQETRCPDGSFPGAAVRALGYEHMTLNSRKGHHGVAILSRRPLVDAAPEQIASLEEARQQRARVPFAGAYITLHNLYVPAGGDIPDAEVNPKFAAKIAFLDALKIWSPRVAAEGRAMLVGDLNVAPLPEDVWSHRQLLDVVSHTPGETERLLLVQQAGDWHDAVRAARPVPEKVFTWWSYRSPDWQASNKGRRLDHAWTTQDLTPFVRSVEICAETRGWERPSDHVPILVTFEA